MSGADQVTFTVVGLAILIVILVIWRVAVHDKQVRLVRFGIFWERERDDPDDELEPEVQHYPE